VTRRGRRGYDRVRRGERRKGRREEGDKEVYLLFL
jgi:hypothetical protein